MKLLLFSGNHSRHLFINKHVLNYFDDVFVIIMERENTIPLPPSTLNMHDKNLFNLHFKNRDIVEKNVYGDLKINDVFKKIKKLLLNHMN